MPDVRELLYSRSSHTANAPLILANEAVGSQAQHRSINVLNYYIRIHYVYGGV